MGKKIFLKGAISPRQDTLANWNGENPILEKGEMGIVTDSKGAKWLKLGDGVTPFCDLPYKETGAEVDAIYNPESANAQSGKAVAEAVEGKMDKFGEIVDITEDNGFRQTILRLPEVEYAIQNKNQSGGLVLSQSSAGLVGEEFIAFGTKDMYFQVGGGLVPNWACFSPNISGVGGMLISGIADPTEYVNTYGDDKYLAVNKGYVDSKIGDINNVLSKLVEVAE